jgi:signal peptidase II
MIRLSPRDWGLVSATAALLLDQLSKAWILYGLGLYQPPDAAAPAREIALAPFFNLVMVWNRGVSYGLFPAHGPLGTALLALFSLIAVIGLGWWLWRAHATALAVGLGLVIGGALGNLVDRLIYGQVADFFHFYIHGYHWYVFNIADCAITFGVAALLYDALLRPEHRVPAQQPRGTPGVTDVE